MGKKIKKIMKEFTDFLGICYGGILDEKELEDICSTLKSLIEANVLPKGTQEKNKIMNVVMGKDSLIEIHDIRVVPPKSIIELDELFGDSGGYSS